jgi:hypothetical protein
MPSAVDELAVFVWRCLFWFPSRRCVCSLATLLAYVVSTVGVPTGNWGKPTFACRCGEELKSSGQCCCSRKLAGRNPASSCCSKAPHAQIDHEDDKSKPLPVNLKPCCAAQSPPKSEGSCCKKRANSLPSELFQVSACGCGGKPLGGIWCNADPRLLNQAASVLRSDLLLAPVQIPEMDFVSLREAPETPPPKRLVG